MSQGYVEEHYEELIARLIEHRGTSRRTAAVGKALAMPAAVGEVLDPAQSSLASESVRYLAFKRKRLTPASERSYRTALSEFITAYPNAVIGDFEPPRGTALIEDFLTARYSHLAPRTYNKALSVLSDFFHWHHARGTLVRDPMLTIERARPRQVHRTTFTDEQRGEILFANPDPHDQIALRLLLDYGIRKGALMNVRYEHFDHNLRRLTIFTKGEKIFTLPIPDPAVWTNLDLLAERGEHYLLSRQRNRKRTPPRRKQLLRMRMSLADTYGQLEAAAEDTHCARETGMFVEALIRATELLDLTIGAASTRVEREPAEKIGEHGAHLWWYRCLARAGVVEPGTNAGRKMHSARHTAGQRVLEKTGNLKAAQALLCHATIGTTGDVYTGWETAQLDETLRSVIPGLAAK